MTNFEKLFSFSGMSLILIIVVIGRKIFLNTFILYLIWCIILLTLLIVLLYFGKCIRYKGCLNKMKNDKKGRSINGIADPFISHLKKEDCRSFLGIPSISERHIELSSYPRHSMSDHSRLIKRRTGHRSGLWRQ